MTLQSKTKAQLLDMLASRGTPASASLKKADLIALVEGQTAAPEPAAPVQAAPVQAAEPQAAPAQPSPAAPTAQAPAEAPSAWPAVAVVVGGFALLAVLGAILFRG
jgi:DNA polymerase-3 subunit gamma/tau